LDENKVNDILEVLDNQAKSFETTPKALAIAWRRRTPRFIIGKFE